MSGIYGCFRLDGQDLDPGDLQGMDTRLAHRGPDGHRWWWDGAMGVGHRMLWSTPESLLEQLPWTTEHLTITADVRLDNRAELLSQLKLSAFQHCAWAQGDPEQLPDSVLIMVAYVQWGERCLDYLLGDFAFVIWDHLRRSFFCARDPLGVKPFFYCYQPGHLFAFSSEIKGLLALEDVSHDLAPEKLGDFLAGITSFSPQTVYRDIQRLAPATTLMVSANEFALHTYWRLDPSHELTLGSDQEYAQAFRNIFLEAVRCRLRSAFPIGSHLSGGIDSSSVTCAARYVLTQEPRPSRVLHTLSNVFEQVPVCDERAYIQTVWEQGNVIPHTTQADQLGPFSDWQRIYDHHDEVMVGPTHFLVWGLNLTAQAAGIRVVLDGFDGDSVLSHGIGYFSELMFKGAWPDLLTEVQAYAQRRGLKSERILQEITSIYLQELVSQAAWLDILRLWPQLSRYTGLSQIKLLGRLGQKVTWLQHPHRWWQRLRRRTTQKSVSIVNPRLAHAIQLPRRVRRYHKARSPLIRSERQHHHVVLNYGLFPLAIEGIDLSCAALGLEPRHPFLDRRVVEFCLSLPGPQKMGDGWTRKIIRLALRDLLPEAIGTRTDKANMSASFRHGLEIVDREIVETCLGHPSPLLDAWIDSAVRTSIYKRDPGIPMQEEEMMNIWRITCLNLWLESFSKKLTNKHTIISKNIA